MFDRSLLPPAILEFVVVTDTHYMLDMTGRQVEFPSRLKQTARAEVALEQIAALAPPFLVHIGDVAQEYPETPRYLQAITEAKAQLDRCGVRRYHAPGNQDIGDKPDPTTPGLPITAAALRVWHEHFGPSWQSFDAAGIHFVVMNSQVLNSTIPEAAEQRTWLERDLAQNHGKRIFVFLHLPLFLRSPDEPHLGHYDNIGQPDRARVIELIRKHNVELVMSGHVHFPFFNRIGKARYLVSQATSFTRPGFSHLFTSPAPPEQGRDQAPMLGFYVVRVMEDRVDLHLVRTSGCTDLPQPLTKGWQRVLTRTPKAMPDSMLGVTLRHPLAWTTQVPIAWPSAIRQKVRNDVPLLACLELGVRQVRVPITDVEDAEQLERLKVLRDEGVRVIAVGVTPDEALTAHRLAAARAHVDELELAVLEGRIDDATRALLQRCAPLNLSAIVARQPVPGKQHPRTRHGYLVADLPQLDKDLAVAGVHVDRVLCRYDGSVPQGDFAHIERVDLAFEFQNADDRTNVAAAVDAMLASAKLPESRLYFEPLIDMDRTMDVFPGLLDTQCNPRPIFHAIRCLNTILATGRKVRLLSSPGDLRKSSRVYRLEQALVKVCSTKDTAELQTLIDAGETLMMEMTHEDH